MPLRQYRSLKPERERKNLVPVSHKRNRWSGQGKFASVGRQHKNNFFNPMPQFDIASFYPQITFFAGIFLMLLVFFTKNTLPKISQNLKLNKRMAELYSSWATPGGVLGDKNLLSHIYKPYNILCFHIYMENVCLIFLCRSVRIVTISYILCLNWLIQTQEKNLNLRLLHLSRVYFKILNDVYVGPMAGGLAKPISRI